MMKKIKDVIRITGLSRRTLQYYDDLGLVKPKRTKENYRFYEKEDLCRIWKVLIYKEMGFQLHEIKALLDGSDEDIDRLLREQLMQIEYEIGNLKRVHQFINKVVNYGMPNQNIADIVDKKRTYKEIVRNLSERRE